MTTVINYYQQRSGEADLALPVHWNGRTDNLSLDLAIAQRTAARAQRYAANAFECSRLDQEQQQQPSRSWLAATLQHPQQPQQTTRQASALAHAAEPMQLQPLPTSATLRGAKPTKSIKSIKSIKPTTADLQQQLQAHRQCAAIQRDVDAATIAALASANENLMRHMAELQEQLASAQRRCGQTERALDWAARQCARIAPLEASEQQLEREKDALQQQLAPLVLRFVAAQQEQGKWEQRALNAEAALQSARARLAMTEEDPLLHQDHALAEEAATSQQEGQQERETEANAAGPDDATVIHSAAVLPVAVAAAPVETRPFTRVGPPPSNVVPISMDAVTMGKTLGKGAFGCVKAATYQDQAVAVKLLHTATPSEQDVDAFDREASIMAALRHANVCRLFGASFDTAHLALVVEKAGLDSLFDVLDWHRLHLTVDIRGRMALGIARGMAYLHAQGIVHRDLKSANVLVMRDWSTKITDFGLAIRKDQITPGACGTIAWMAPEVLDGRAYDEKADVYSFGIVLYELLTGCDPYPGMSDDEIQIRVVNEGLRPVPEPWFPPLWIALMELCWDQEPTKRRSFAELVEDLEDVYDPPSPASASAM